MKHSKKALALLAAAALSVALLGACSSTAQEDPADKVTLGRSIVVDSSGVVFWSYGPYICTGLLDGEGHIYDPVIEGQTTSDIYSMAVYDKDLYLASSDGLFRYDLEIFQEGGTMSPDLLTEDSIDDGFEIYQDTLYYNYGTSLYSIPIGGGEETKLAPDVDSFTVTTDGIYYASSNGGLYLLSFDGSLQERVAETDPDCQFCLVGDTIFYRCEKNDQICELSLSDGSVSVVNKPSALSDYSYVWANETYLVYEDDHYERFAFLRDGSGETSLGDNGVLADKGEGFFLGDILYTCNPYSGDVQEYHLATGEAVLLESSAVLKDLVSQAAQEQADAATGATTASADYDILCNMQVRDGENNTSWVLTDYVVMSVPNVCAWYIDQHDAYTFSLVCTEAENDGYGGQVITVKAYPVGDTSYEQAPSYALAGRADGMQYVVFYPTDVQFDPNNQEQADAYRTMLDHFQQLDGEDSPLVCGAIS